MLVINQDILMNYVKIRLDILEVWLTDSFQQNYGNLLTCIDIVRTDDFDDLGGNCLISIMDQLFNEIEVNQNDFLFWT